MSAPQIPSEADTDGRVPTVAFARPSIAERRSEGRPYSCAKSIPTLCMGTPSEGLQGRREDPRVVAPADIGAGLDPRGGAHESRPSAHGDRDAGVSQREATTNA